MIISTYLPDCASFNLVSPSILLNASTLELGVVVWLGYQQAFDLCACKMGL